MIKTVKERPWHGIGTVVDTAPCSADALKIAKAEGRKQKGLRGDEDYLGMLKDGLI